MNSSYSIETILETREPNVIELFGDAPGVVHKVSGLLLLHVTKTIHLKELSVVFLCEGTPLPSLSFFTLLPFLRFVLSYVC